MDKQKHILLTAAECAGRIGISVRALRVYEKHGLLNPVRTEKNWRLYGPQDIARLNEVMFLKRLGLRLADIANLLSGQMTEIDRLLEMQETLQTNQLEQTQHSLKLIRSLRAKCSSHDGLSMDDLLSLAKETQMNETADEFAWKRYLQARPRTPTDPAPGALQECIGEYKLECGSVFRLTAKENRLSVAFLGQPACDLFYEEKDHYFLKVTPAQFVFFRDGAGEIEGLVLHEGGHETKAWRCENGTYDRAERQLKTRMETKSPFPGSEALLRKVIDEHRQGKPDYDNMSPALQLLAREQMPAIVCELDRLGQETSIEFRGVGADGFDVYLVDFENGRLEWGLAQAENGILTGLYLRPAL